MKRHGVILLCINCNLKLSMGPVYALVVSVKSCWIHDFDCAFSVYSPGVNIQSYALDHAGMQWLELPIIYQMENIGFLKR